MNTFKDTLSVLKVKNLGEKALYAQNSLDGKKMIYFGWRNKMN